MHREFKKKLRNKKSIFERYFFKHLPFCLFDIIGCLPGYIGMNCSFKCPYPSYGIKCQGICYCSDEQCDVTTGCNTVTTGNVHLYIVVFIIYL